MMLDVPSSVQSNPQQNFTKRYDRSPIIRQQPSFILFFNNIQKLPLSLELLKVYRHSLSRCHQASAQQNSMPRLEGDDHLSNHPSRWDWMECSNVEFQPRRTNDFFCRELNSWSFFMFFVWFINVCWWLLEGNQVILPKVWCFFVFFLKVFLGQKVGLREGWCVDWSVWC